MKLIHNLTTYLPIKATYSKSDKPVNNKLTIVLPPEHYKDFSIDDYGYLYTSDDVLLFNGYLVNISLNISSSSPQTVLSFFDKESLMFNRNWSETVTNAAPLIIGSVLSKVTNDLEGSKLSRVTIKYVGYPRTDGIQVTVTNHPEIEFTNEDIANETQAYLDYVNLPAEDKFTSITYGAMMKPVFEWVKELSQPQNTKTNNVYVWYLDENDIFRWYATSSITSPPTEHLYIDYTIESKQESSVNFIIAYLGDDLNGAPIYIYKYKEYSGTPNIQESIKDWADIARDLKEEYTDNDAFRAAVEEKGYARARSYFESLTLGKTTGTFALKEPKYRVGDLLQITHAFGNESYHVLIKSVSVSYDIKRGTSYKYEYEEVIQ